MYRPKFSHRVIAVFLTLNFLISIVPVNHILANNNGPNAPEASGFEPVDATDMVNLSTGDTAYVLPLIDVGAFPVTLSYHSGIPLDMESSWVGLGWNLNTGAITRGVSATPDDWNAANTLDFIYFENSENFYSINVGFGISKAAEVGVGISWGSNKSLAGSVFGSFAGVSASLATDGSYSVGFGVGFGQTTEGGAGAGISISGNLNGGKPTYGIGVGGRNGNMTGSMGVSLSDSGASFSISAGYSNKDSYKTGQAGGGGLSMGNYSSGDFDISSKGFFIPIQLGPFSFGFGKQKVTYKLRKGYEKTGYGVLYSKNAVSSDPTVNDLTNAHKFSDYQNRYTYTDMYDQVLPVGEEEYVADSNADNIKLNFSYAAYDSYEVNATGISGSLKPRVFENSVLFGLGYKGAYPDASNEEKMRIYYHNSKGNTLSSYLPTKTLGTNFHFYFDGQFTQITEIPYLNYTNNFSFNSSTSKTLKNYLPSGRFIDNARKKSGNFVEVYTNYQIRTGQATGLLEPDGLAHSSRTDMDFIDSGIGGYKVTSPDVKTYHYALPVYNYERVERTNLKDNSGNYVNEKRQFTPFATHWLLTAITGPDYVDSNGNNFPDQDDYGYWVRLDHGRWSNAYTWRSPYSGVNYNTNLKSEIEDSDFGNWQYGRKDLYYLDRIVSQTHTAYFVKDIRYDSTGAKTSALNNGSSFIYQYTGITNVPDATGINESGSGPYVKEAGISYKREYQLVLDKIVIVPTSFDTVNKNQSTESLNKQNLPGYNANESYQLTYDINGGFYREKNARPSAKIHQEDNVYDINDFHNFDYSKAIKTIQFNYNYELAKNTPSSYQCFNNVSASNPPNTGKGRLTLKEVQFLGKNQVEYMPSYKFEYKGVNFTYPVGHYQSVNSEVRKAKDEWGFIDEQYYLRNYIEDTYNVTPDDTNYRTYHNLHYAQFAESHGPDNWSLEKITMPTGSTINFDYEEDDYYTEAFSRRAWTEGFSARFTSENGNRYMYFRQSQDYIDDEIINFNDYFNENDSVFLNTQYFRNPSVGDQGYRIADFAGEFEIVYVTQNEIKILLPSTNNNSTYRQSCEETPWSFSQFYASGSSTASVVDRFQNFQIPFGTAGCGFVGNGNSRFSYKILANRIPKDQTGGGLRVKSITLQDDNNNNYLTKYFYNKPGTNKVKNQGNYESSGITSFSPVNGLKFVPYQSELPGAGVMYEYVTMVSESNEGVSLGETRYRFHTLQPVTDIFNPNLKMYDDQGTEIFGATVTNANNHSDGLLHNDQKVYAKNIHLDINTSLVGQFRSIESFNSVGQLLSKTEKNYLSGPELAFFDNRGYVMESFINMKSIFKSNSDDNNPVLQKRLLSQSSKREYTSVVTRSKTSTQFGISSEQYSNADPETGAFRTTRTDYSDGTYKITDKIPAYTKYALMGSKVGDVNNKHMLTQSAMEITQFNTSNQTLNANITTWKDTWTYRDDFGINNTQGSIWRKHKQFVWKDDINPVTGTYLTTVSNDVPYFNWGTGAPTSDKWQQVSEVTRYTHWSAPLESKDINNNFASSKMADNFSKVIASSNARYTEMYYSGAEYIAAGNTFEGEVEGANFRTNEVAHTGEYSVKTNAANDKVFAINGQVGSNHLDLSKDFRPGKYKVSFWSHNQFNADNASLNLNGNAISPSETVDAGCWKQFNYYVDLIPNSSFNLYVTNTFGGGFYFDDFRMHPVYSSMNSFVYDHKTDELLYILDANNMGSSFSYDVAGRLASTYIEVEDTEAFDGGFKLMQQYRQHYQNSESNSASYNNDINNCISQSFDPLKLKGLTRNCTPQFNPYEIQYAMHVSGGSGHYKYEWQYLLNPSTGQFSNWYTGNEFEFIPYALRYCDQETFDKIWGVNARVTDLATGEVIEDRADYSVESCSGYISNPKILLGVEASTCYASCGGSKYNFRLYPLDPNLPLPANIGYVDNISDVSYSMDLVSGDGIFCAEIKYVESNTCSTGYIKFVSIRPTHFSSTDYSYDFYLECVSQGEIDLNSGRIAGVAPDLKYASPGIIITKQSGKIISVIDTNKKL